MIRRLLASYPSANPGDAKGYTIELSNVLLRYPANVARDAVRQAQCSLRWLPSIAELTECCDRAIDRMQQQERYADLPEVRLERGYRKPTGSSTRGELCERYGIPAVPGGWDAVDLLQAEKRFGKEGMREQVTAALAVDSPSDSPFSRLVRELRTEVSDAAE